MLTNRLIIQKTAFAGVAFFNQDDLNADELRFVAQHVDEASMRDVDKVLVCPFTQVDRLLPTEILADYQCADAI